MPKSCLLVFPHCDRKRQISPFQIGTFHFRFFLSSPPLRFNISYLPTFFPKPVYLYGVLSKNSVNRYWVAMALSHRKRPRQFVSSYSFERNEVLGRIILLLSPGLHSWHALRLRSGCSGPPGYTMFYTCLPLVSTCVPLVSYSPAFRMMCLMCLNSTQQHWTGRQEITTKQRERPTAANIHQQHLPKEESERKARAPTKDTKEQPKKGREGERTRKSKPGETRSKTRSKRDPSPGRSKLPESKIGRLNHMKGKPTGKILRTLGHRIEAAQAGRTQRKCAEPSTSRQIPAGTDSNSRGRNHTEPKYDKFQWARLSPNY